MTLAISFWHAEYRHMVARYIPRNVVRLYNNEWALQFSWILWYPWARSRSLPRTSTLAIVIHFDGRQNDKFRGKRNLRKTAYSFTLHCKDSMPHLSSQVTAEDITSTLLTAAGAELEAPDSDMPLYISKVPWITLMSWQEHTVCKHFCKLISRECWVEKWRRVPAQCSQADINCSVYVYNVYKAQCVWQISLSSTFTLSFTS